jgi:hypothetical protein
VVGSFFRKPCPQELKKPVLATGVLVYFHHLSNNTGLSHLQCMRHAFRNSRSMSVLARSLKTHLSISRSTTEIEAVHPCGIRKILPAHIQPPQARTGFQTQSLSMDHRRLLTEIDLSHRRINASSLSAKVRTPRTPTLACPFQK